MAAIDVGSAATDRADSVSLATAYSPDTAVDGNNAANADGSIDTVEIWLNNAATDTKDGGLWFGTFSASGNVLTCRDSEGVGACAAGSKQTFTGLDITVVTGDYIGACHRGTDSCTVDRVTSGAAGGIWPASTEIIDPTDSASFEYASGHAISLYGTGDTGETTYTTTVALSALLRDTDSEAVNLSALLRDTDSTSAALDALLRDTDLTTVALDVLLGLMQQSVNLDALLRDTDLTTIALTALLRDVDWETIDLDVLAVDRLLSLVALSTLLRDTDSKTVNLTAAIEATDLETVALDVILKDQTYNAPYYIEVRDPSGVLLGVIRDLIDGSLEQITNAPDVVGLTIPLNELRASYLTRKNQVWVRDSATDTVISVCRIQMTEESD
jgi:hypothetical protein